jgi:hypothetical protein
VDISRDGVAWRPIEGMALNAAAFDGDTGWGIGIKGTIAECLKKKL